MRTSTLTACLLILLAGPAFAQTYTIKLKEYPDAGKSMTAKSKDVSTRIVKVTDSTGAVVQDRKEELGKEKEYTLTTEEKGAKAPKKFKKTYTKASEGPKDKPEALSYQGKTLAFELKDGKYEVSVDGKGELSRRDQTDLLRSANRDLEGGNQIFMPTKAVKVDETWTFDKKKAARNLGLEFDVDLAKSTGEGKLLKAYKKDGKQYGVIELKAKFAVKKVQDLTFDPPAVFDAKITYDGVIDGTGTANQVVMVASFKGKGTAEQGGKKFTVELNVETKGDSAESEQK